MRNATSLILCILFSSAAAFAQTNPQLSPDPNTVKIVTSDIDNFWRAFDLAKNEKNRSRKIAVFQTEYIEKGSSGLKDLLTSKIKLAENLVDKIDGSPAYYTPFRLATPHFKRLEERIRSRFVKFKSIYRDAVFPDVYFVVGDGSSGGMNSNSGLVVAADTYGASWGGSADHPVRWMTAVAGAVDKVLGTVAHETCHYNQRYGISQPTLLSESIREGSCDWLGELAGVQRVKRYIKTFDFSDDGEIWRDFKANMYKTGYPKVIYKGEKVSVRPDDLDQHVAYLITRQYYRRAKDKNQAVRDILNIQDFRKFYEASR